MSPEYFLATAYRIPSEPFAPPRCQVPETCVSRRHRPASGHTENFFSNPRRSSPSQATDLSVPGLAFTALFPGALLLQSASGVLEVVDRVLVKSGVLFGEVR